MLRFFGVSQPLTLSWRKFLALAQNMPSTSVFYQRIHTEEAEANETISDTLDRLMGREPAVRAAGPAVQAFERMVKP